MKSCNIGSHKGGALDEAEKTSFAQLHPTLVGPVHPWVAGRCMEGQRRRAGVQRRRGVEEDVVVHKSGVVEPPFARSRRAALCAESPGG